MANLKRSYANALFELSQESGTLENDLEQILLIRDTLDYPEVQAFLSHPHISDSEKYELFNKAFSDNINKRIMGFLYLLVKKNRESLIIPVLAEYIERTNRYLGRTVAKVVSAKELTEKQIESIDEILAKQIDMDVKIKAIVDPDVIGGFYILVNGRIFDGTVRSELNIMRERLKRGSYEW